tara:strand:- start:419 stop:898 length:480 start_codon:yes stop_codon:yes gene_type:complete
MKNIFFFIFAFSCIFSATSVSVAVAKNKVIGYHSHGINSSIQLPIFYKVEKESVSSFFRTSYTEQIKICKNIFQCKQRGEIRVTRLIPLLQLLEEKFLKKGFVVWYYLNNKLPLTPKQITNLKRLKIQNKQNLLIYTNPKFYIQMKRLGFNVDLEENFL